MKLVVCLDDNFGILFNNRRQSSDVVQREDFKKIVLDKKVYLSEYSYDLYKDMDLNFEVISEETEISEDSFFIYEGEFLEKILENVDEIILYFWNRVYPADTDFEIPTGFKEIESFDFVGNSHDKISRKLYIKEK